MNDRPSVETGLCTRGAQCSQEDKHAAELTTPRSDLASTPPSARHVNTVNTVTDSLSSSGRATDGRDDHDDGINLHTQHNDEKLATIIDYIQQGTLPADDKIARRICLTRDQFAIRDNRLIHIGVKRRKNNATDNPIAEQICIPKAMQPIVLARYHQQLMHPGHEKMYLTLKERVYWDNMYTDVRNYVANCEQCHTAKANNHPVKVKLHSREVPAQIFQRVHLDHLKINVKGATHGYTHALVIIDAASLCCEIIPVKSTSAEETCKVLIREWISRYGVFAELVTDRHAAFTGKLTRLLLQWCGIKHVLISPYSSRSNGQCEKMNGVVVQGLRICCKGLTEWPTLLAPIAAAYKAAVVPSRGASPFKLMFGVDMRLPIETELAKIMPTHQRNTSSANDIAKQLALMRQNAQKLAETTRERSTQAANKNRTDHQFQPGDRVYKIRDALGEHDDRKTASKFLGPYTILERGDNDVYKLANFYTGRILRNFVHADKLKTCQKARAGKRANAAINNVHRADKPQRGLPGERREAAAGDDIGTPRQPGGGATPIAHAEQTNDSSELCEAFGYTGLGIEPFKGLTTDRRVPNLKQNVFPYNEHGRAVSGGKPRLHGYTNRGTPRYSCGPRRRRRPSVKKRQNDYERNH